MRNKKLNKLIDQVENYLECWKQFNGFLNVARAKKFNPDEDTLFLETKSVLVQELELILAAVDVTSPTKEDIHSLVGNAPSLRYLSELGDGNLRNLENQWHKIYIGWHAILGQLKVRRHQEENKSALSGVFARK
jgi:hypothetical protein